MERKVLNVFLYARDSRGAQSVIFDQLDKLKEYVKNIFGEVNIKIYIDKCGINDECRALQKMVDDIQVEDVDWVVTTYSNRFYRVNYKDGRKKLLKLLNDINKNGTNIAFSEETVQLKNEQDILMYANGLN